MKTNISIQILSGVKINSTAKYITGKKSGPQRQKQETNILSNCENRILLKNKLFCSY